MSRADAGATLRVGCTGWKFGVVALLLVGKDEGEKGGAHFVQGKKVGARGRWAGKVTRIRAHLRGSLSGASERTSGIFYRAAATRRYSSFRPLSCRETARAARGEREHAPFPRDERMPKFLRVTKGVKEGKDGTCTLWEATSIFEGIWRGQYK